MKMEDDKSSCLEKETTSKDAIELESKCISISGKPKKDYKSDMNSQEQTVDTDVSMIPRTDSKGDIELFEQLIDNWKCQEIESQTLENNLKQKVQHLEKREVYHKSRISDLEETSELLQKTIDGIHNELDLIDKLKKELDEKKEIIESLEHKLTLQKSQMDEKVAEHEEQDAQNQKDHENELENLQKEIFNKLQEKDKEISDVLAMKNSEVEQLRKDKNLEIKTLIENYEGKLSAVQEEKMAALMDQQHRFSTNKELMRQRFEYSQRQYETEINQLKDQVRIAQKPVPTPGSRRSAPKQTVVAKPLFKKAKNF